MFSIYFLYSKYVPKYKKRKKKLKWNCDIFGLVEARRRADTKKTRHRRSWSTRCIEANRWMALGEGRRIRKNYSIEKWKNANQLKWLSVRSLRLFRNKMRSDNTRPVKCSQDIGNFRLGNVTGQNCFRRRPTLVYTQYWRHSVFVIYVVTLRVTWWHFLVHPLVAFPSCLFLVV